MIGYWVDEMAIGFSNRMEKTQSKRRVGEDSEENP